ncbi:MAG TPA: NlpC/P60 family protein [Bacillota bacterium]|nr:NlpC/P60 family protein [Bacillota bacterium]
MKNRLMNLALVSAVVSSVFFILAVSVFADIGDTALKKGMRHPDVAVLQERLDVLGYFENEEYTDYFGDKTYAALIAFQSDSGLKQDGVAGKDTFKMLSIKIKQNEILPENFVPIKEGDSGDKVVDIQKKLRDLGIYKTEINSFYDKTTIDAVSEFQAANSLPQTGIVDGATIIKLNTITNDKIAARAAESRRLLGDKAVDFAKQFLGAPYKWGASSGKAFDCSGFTVYIMKKFNVILERTASAQFNSGTKVEKSNLQAGDLVFFTTYKKGPSHVGMYIGDNKFIHASSATRSVTITDLDTKYYKARYLGARRYNLKEN